MSIPKIIHYCWFGEKAMPAKCKRVIETWKKHLPDYEIRLWDESTFDVSKSEYTKAAYDAGKYAFVSDYARLYALKEYGGIYLDADVEVVRSFDDLLPEYDAVFGFEAEGRVMSAFIAAKAHHPIIHEFLEAYEHETFDPAKLVPNTVILTDILKNRGLIINNTSQVLAENTAVFSLDYFQTYDFSKAKLCITENTYTIHKCFGSWCSLKDRVIFKSKYILGKLLPEKGYYILKQIKKKIMGR